MKDLSLLQHVAHSISLALLVARADEPPRRPSDSDSDPDRETVPYINEPGPNVIIQCLEKSLDELTDAQRSGSLYDGAAAMEELARKCSARCSRMISAARRPRRIATSSETWRSSRPAAGNQVLELRRLSERLEDLQVLLTSQLGRTLSGYIAASKVRLRQLQLDSRRLRCRNSQRLTTISSLLRSLETTVRSCQQKNPDNLPSSGDITVCQAQLEQMIKQQLRLGQDYAVLKSLVFRSSVARHDTIPAAHRRTFAWVFSAPQIEEEEEESNLSLKTWLERGHGVFWVSGKPGAGKSTLIKFIADHELAQAALSKWSAPKKAAVVSHYFWCAGTPMQRSHAGLLQTLLFEVLRQLPDHIQTLLPERWADSAGDWTVPELYAALHGIIGRDDLPVKFCFFIDGLDEFEGDHMALCQELLVLARSENIKLCLSSRPWSVFEEAFGDGKTGHLRLHHVTKNDIIGFVRDGFDQYPETRELTRSEVETIAEEISECSQGVFLWVSLATKGLLEAITERPSLSCLLQTLREYPPELDDLFTYNLEAVPTDDQALMATSFLITEAAEKPLHVGMYYFHKMEFSNPGYVFTLSPEPPGRLEYRQQLQHTTQQLETLCRGLLTVNPNTKVVSCLHRTVKDYLDRPGIQAMLFNRAPPGFSTNLCLLRASAAWTKSSRATVSDEPKKEYLSSITSLLGAAAQLHSREDVEVVRQLLDDLDDCLLAKGPGAEESLQILRAQVVGHRLWRYLSNVQVRKPGYFDAFVTVPPLVLALFPDYEVGAAVRECRWDDEATVMTLRCLFSQDQGPNAPFSTSETLGAGAQKTPFSVLCEHVLPHHDDTGSVRKVQLKKALQSGVMDAFLAHGANPMARCERPGKPVSSASTDYLLHAFRLCDDGDGEGEGDEILKEMYLRQVHGFAPRDDEHLEAVLRDFSRLMERFQGQQEVLFLRSVYAKLTEVLDERVMESFKSRVCRDSRSSDS